jgi:hypothetical protein
MNGSAAEVSEIPGEMYDPPPRCPALHAERFARAPVPFEGWERGMWRDERCDRPGSERPLVSAIKWGAHFSPCSTFARGGEISITSKIPCCWPIF